MKKNPRVIWVCPDSEYFYRSSGEVQSRLNPILSKLSEKGVVVHILLPYDAALLPKTKLSPSRILKTVVSLKGKYDVEFIKLTRSTLLPSIHMVKIPPIGSAAASAILAKSAISFAQRLKKPIDVIHLFGWQSSLVPYFLDETGKRPPLLQKTRTILTIKSIFDQGNFSLEAVAPLGLPESLFQPEGFEFFGQFSFLKAGVMLSDVVSLVSPPRSKKASNISAAQRFENILKWQSSKIRLWASERGVKSYFSVYEELSVGAPARSAVAPLLKKLKLKEEATKQERLNHWGPPTPTAYFNNSICLLTQSPRKAFSYWEWVGNKASFKEFGVLLKNLSQKNSSVLARGVDTLGEFWVDVAPDQEYVLEFVGWANTGELKVLLQSNRIKTPRETPSSNKNVIFIDVRNKKQVAVNSLLQWLSPNIKWGGSSIDQHIVKEKWPSESLSSPLPSSLSVRRT